MKLLSLSSVKNGAIASILALAAVSCGGLANHNKKLCEQAEANAAQYLTGAEYLQAKEIADIYIDPSIAASNDLVNYWDSINTHYKAQRAYSEGVKMVQDSAAGKYYAKPEYKMPIQNHIKVEENGGYGELADLLDNITKESVKNFNGLEAKEHLENQPEKSSSDYKWPDKRGFARLHYWNEIISVGKQRKAFNDGANAERAKLNK